MFPYAYSYIRKPKIVSDCLTWKIKIESLSLYDIQKKRDMDNFFHLILILFI